VKAVLANKLANSVSYFFVADSSRSRLKNWTLSAPALDLGMVPTALNLALASAPLKKY
jgi:hypothetical protein